jgi:hypothetical protein
MIVASSIFVKHKGTDISKACEESRLLATMSFLSISDFLIAIYYFRFVPLVFFGRLMLLIPQQAEPNGRHARACESADPTFGISNRARQCQGKSSSVSPV